MVLNTNIPKMGRQVSILTDYRRAFAYRINSYTFAAPQIPGVYYLYVPSEGGDHYLVEIEVRGFIEEAIE